MSRCAPPSPSPRRTLRSLSSSAIRSARVFHDWTVNSFSRSSSSVTSSSASTPSTPRSAAISATVLPSYLFSPADLTSCTVIRAQSAKEAGRFRSCLNWFLKFTSLYTADCAAFDVSSNSRFHDGNAPNANGLRMVSSRVSGRGEVCGRAPRAIIGRTFAIVSRSASGRSSRSNIAMNVIGRRLSSSMKSSSSSSGCSSTAIWRVIANSIDPLPRSRSALQYAFSSSRLALRHASGLP